MIENYISAHHKEGFPNSYKRLKMPFASLESSGVSAFDSVQLRAEQSLDKCWSNQALPDVWTCITR